MKIKDNPEDFYVREIINLKSKTPGTKYAYFLMWKRNISTIRAIKIISKKLRISKKRIFFAGEKDKKTVSEQYIAIRALSEFKNEYNFGNVKLKYIGSFEEPLRISDLIANKFIIIIKDLNENELKIFEENSEIFKNYFFNYFDDQRFGNIRYINHLIGKEIIKRNWENAVKILLTYSSENENENSRKAREWLKNNWGKFEEAIKIFPKWLDIELSVINYLIKEKNYYKALKEIHKRLLKLFLHSYQAYLWNITLSEYIKKKSSQTCKIKIANNYFYISKDMEFLEKIKNLKIKTVGYDLNLNNIEDKDLFYIYKEIIENEKIFLEDLYFKDKPSLSLRSIERNSIAKVSEFDYNIIDNKIKISFCLEKGSYATTFLKHLFAKS